MHWIFYLNILFSLLELPHPSLPEYVFRIQSIHFSPGVPRWLESERHSVVSDSLRPHGLYSPWNSPGQDTGVGSLSLLQGIFPTQGSNHGLCSPWNSPGQNTGVGSLSLLQWIFATQELNRGLLHCRQILYQLSYQRSPGGLILENLPAKGGDIGSILGLGRCRREGNGNSLQYF